MKNIKIFTTGGTISSSPDNKTGLLKTGSVSGMELLESLSMKREINIDVQEIFSVPSNHLDFYLLTTLKEAVDSAVNSPCVDGIVITHGTDTLEETTYFLDLVIDTEKPVVVTGSQRSAVSPGSDAGMNLSQAVQAAADDKSCDMGVLVLFNEQIHCAREVRKVHASSVTGFSSPGWGPVGIVDLGDVIYCRKPLQRKTYPFLSSLPQVDLIVCSLGSDGKFIKSSIISGSQGIVLDGFGRGNVPPAVMTNLEESVDEGLIVVITSQASEGRVYPVYDFPGSSADLLTKGVISGGSLSGRKARIKLAVLLNVFGSDAERIAEEFLENY